jgi:hypothetical protein
MSLEIPTEAEIAAKFEYRWPRLCLDPRFWLAEKKSAFDPAGKWAEIPFDKLSKPRLTHLSQKQGLYMFVAKPSGCVAPDHSYILYVGETSDLLERFNSYFRYRTSTNPSDQKKRRMVIVWEGCLHFCYVRTPDGWSATQRREAEYDLIDSIAPPINDDFRSVILNTYKKSLEF